MRRDPSNFHFDLSLMVMFRVPHPMELASAVPGRMISPYAAFDVLEEDHPGWYAGLHTSKCMTCHKIRDTFGVGSETTSSRIR
jgi:hypothetical protein